MKPVYPLLQSFKKYKNSKKTVNIYTYTEIDKGIKHTKLHKHSCGNICAFLLIHLITKLSSGSNDSYY